MSRRSVRMPVLPPVGPCRLSRWVAEVGARLEADALYAEVESHKALMELRAPAPCRLVERCVLDGADVEEGVVVAVLELDEEGDDAELAPTLHYRYLGPPRA